MSFVLAGCVLLLALLAGVVLDGIGINRSPLGAQSRNDILLGADTNGTTRHYSKDAVRGWQDQGPKPALASARSAALEAVGAHEDIWAKPTSVGANCDALRSCPPRPTLKVKLRRALVHG